MAKTGPKEYQADWEKIDKMCAIQCTGEEIAGILGVDYDTLQRACKRDHDVKFAEYIREKGSTGKMSLRRRQYTSAMDGNATMLVWLGKNWLGQVDKKESDRDDSTQHLVDALQEVMNSMKV